MATRRSAVGHREVRPAGTFAPLGVAPFRALWVVQLTGQLVTWTNSVTTQWILTTAGDSPAVIAAVTAAAALPSFLFGMIAGAAVDIVDRRRLLFGIQPAMVLVAIVTATLSFFHLLPAPALIVSTFLLGTGAAFSNPAVTSAIPGVVGRDLMPAAMSLISINANAARIAGPVIAGILLSTAGAPAAFVVSAVVLAASIFSVARWPATSGTAGGRSFAGAIRTGVDFVRYAPGFRAVIVAGAGFVIPATAVWSLLSVVAHDQLKLGSGAYGLLFSSLGVGAIVAGLLAPRIQRLGRASLLLLLSSVGYGVATAVLAVVPSPIVAGAALVVIGAGWMLAANTVMLACQALLPNWVRGRGIAAWYTVLFGSQVAGAALWGLIAQWVGSVPALMTAAIAVIVTGTVSFLEHVPARPGDERSQTAGTSDRVDERPRLLGAGPVTVVVEYIVNIEDEAAFEAVLEELGRSRRRTGARRWRLFRHAEREGVYIEMFDLDSWEERTLQADRRRHPAESAVADRVRELATGIAVQYFGRPPSRRRRRTRRQEEVG